MQSDCDDDDVDPTRDCALESMWAARAIDQTLNALSLEGSDPVVERPAADVELLACGFDTQLGC